MLVYHALHLGVLTHCKVYKDQGPMISTMRKTRTESRNWMIKNVISCNIVEFAKMWMQFIKIWIFPTIISIFSQL